MDFDLIQAEMLGYCYVSGNEPASTGLHDTTNF